MKIALHIGCGPILIPSTPEIAWANIDKEAHFTSDTPQFLRWNCLDLVPRFGPRVADIIWSCHMLEHLEYPRETTSFLADCHKLLKPGGILRLAVPDLELVAKAYVAGSDLKFIHGPDFKAYYHKSESRAERLHWFTHSWEHTITFDFDLLSSLLFDAGFKNGIWRKGFNESSIPNWNHDRFQSESLYVEAVK